MHFPSSHLKFLFTCKLTIAPFNAFILNLQYILVTDLYFLLMPILLSKTGDGPKIAHSCTCIISTVTSYLIGPSHCDNKLA